ncbi:MAG: two-component system response regulator [Acidobacteria bacterium]|jgi:putative nucleotidyltransferase with HDIG domain|nr:MAG: two-component system response regulator [Acidobacteriota bacterium]PYV89092.1 MAG: two-component system response regulator [Acidobacteriota bacterium]
MATERILVVDDEETIREIVCSMLTSAKYECRQAGSGMEALALLDSGEEFELMLSDLMMANLDGIGLLERTKERFPDMPVVMVTAVHDISVALAALRNGAYDYLLKPFEREQLLATVRRALENRRLKLENRAYQTNLESQVMARTEQLRRANGQLKEAMTDLERSYDITLEALGGALDLKDAETEGHSRRVTAFTIAIAKAMGLNKDQIKVIARGAFLHDIGKMAIPDRILLKPDKLTPEEVQVMREHCYHGYQMLKRIPFLAEAAEIVYTHQERFDGTGYPRMLKAEQIPLGARIFSVADTLDAITSDRPYRRKQSIEAACKEIQDWSGRQFDPEVVKTFLEMPKSIWDDLRREVAYSTSAK